MTSTETSSEHPGEDAVPFPCFFFFSLAPDCEVCATRWHLESADDMPRPQDPEVMTLRRFGFYSSWLCFVYPTSLRKKNAKETLYSTG